MSEGKRPPSALEDLQGLIWALAILVSVIVIPIYAGIVKPFDFSYRNTILLMFSLTVASVQWLIFAGTRCSISRACFKKLTMALGQSRPLLILFSLFVWVLISSLVNDPGFTLLGSVEDNSDAALYYLSLLASSLLIAKQASSSISIRNKILAAVWATGLVIAAISVFEVLTGRSLLSIAVSSQLPVATFLGKGHLAGYMLLPLSLSACTPTLAALFVAFLYSMTIGFTYNRSSWLGMVMLAVLAARSHGQQWKRLIFALALGLSLGLFLVGKHTRGGAPRALENPGTLEARFYYWLSAVRGIAKRPLFGWGGGAYYMHWSEFLSDEELGLFFEKHGYSLVAHGKYFFLLETPDGKRILQRITGWKAHNQFLDVALMWGTPGALIYILLLLYLVPRIKTGDPSAIAVLAYHIFLLFWFMPMEAGFTVWALWGVAFGKWTETEVTTP